MTLPTDAPTATPTSTPVSLLVVGGANADVDDPAAAVTGEVIDGVVGNIVVPDAPLYKSTTLE